MTGSKRFAVQIIPEAGLDEKYNATIRIREVESSFSEIPHLVKLVPLAELKDQLHRLGFDQEQIDCTLSRFAHERSVTYTMGFAPRSLEVEGFRPE